VILLLNRMNDVEGGDVSSGETGPGTGKVDDVTEALFSLNNIRVRRIHISGLKRTNNRFFNSRSMFTPLLTSGNLEGVLESSEAVKEKLLSLGIFRDVTVLLDASPAPHAKGDQGCDKKNLDVTFEVDEAPWRGANAMLSTSSQEASAEAGLRFPNLFGRAESLKVGYSKSTDRSAMYHLDLTKPVGRDLNTKLKCSLLRSFEPSLMSKYHVLNRGFTLDVSNYSRHLTHTLKYTGCWRHVSCPDPSTPIDVRLESGHTVYSALSYVLSFDSRSAKPCPGMPGVHMQTQVDLAGRLLGGDAHFLKTEARLKKVVSLPLGTYLGLTARAGHIFPLAERSVSLLDKFFVGGPMCVRGFSAGGIGASQDNCALGGTSFWTTGLSLYSRLPYRPSLGGFGDKLWLHGFVNAGNISNDKDLTADTAIRRMTQQASWSCGIGLHFSIANMVRAELNYCLPRSSRTTDVTAPGFQFGIGIDL
jgi:outer membrane protein insertion porin family